MWLFLDKSTTTLNLAMVEIQNDILFEKSKKYENYIFLLSTEKSHELSEKIIFEISEI